MDNDLEDLSEDGVTALEDLSGGELEVVQEIARQRNSADARRPNYLLARALDPEKSVKGETWDSLIEEVLGKLASDGMTLRPQQAKLYRKVLRVLLANLLAAHSQNDRLFLRYNRGHRSTADGFPFKPKIALLNGLVCSGLATGRMGYLDRTSGCSMQARVQATPALADLAAKLGARPEDIITDTPPLILRGKKGSPLSFKLTQDVKAMIGRVERINQFLVPLKLDLVLPKGKPSPRFLDGTPVDTTKKRLCRIFNGRSFLLGGRFYGHWVQNIPAHYRAHLTINGEPTVELDYGGCHPNMLRAKAGLPPMADPYAIPGVTLNREIIKKVVAVALNHDRPATAAQAVMHSVNTETSGQLDKKGAHALLDEVTQHHSDIAIHFFTGVALSLMYEDSCLAEGIMLHLISHDIPVIPVHDSFVVPARYCDVLRETMTNTYFDRFNVYPIIK